MIGDLSCHFYYGIYHLSLYICSEIKVMSRWHFTKTIQYQRNKKQKLVQCDQSQLLLSSPTESQSKKYSSKLLLSGNNVFIPQLTNISFIQNH